MSSIDTESPENEDASARLVTRVEAAVTAITSLTAADLSSAHTQLRQLCMSRQNGKSTFFQYLTHWKSLSKRKPVNNENEIRALAGILCKAIQDNGIAEFKLEYTGAGDNTDGFSTNIVPGDKQQLAATVMVTYSLTHTEWTGAAHVPRVTEQTASLEDATYALAELMWSHAGQSGWYNNEGGGGSVTLFPGGTYEFRHYNYVQEEEEAAHWRANIFAGPIDAPYEETVET